MKRILVVHNRYNVYGGEDACVDNEIAALREAGLSVLEARPTSQRNFKTRINALVAPFGRAEEKFAESLIEKHRPDIVHIHNLFPLLSPRIFAQAKKQGAKIVMTLHNYRPLCLNGLFMTPRLEICERCRNGNFVPGILRGCYRRNRLQSIALATHLWASRRLGWYQLVDSFIAPCQFLKEKFVACGFAKEKMTVQGHFLLQMPAATPKPPQPYVLYMGRLSEEKGILWLFRAFRECPFPVRLLIAGTGPLQKQVEKSCDSRIEYLGFLDQTAKERILPQALALVVPSECFENFPLAIMEANSWGVPALVSNQGGLGEIVATKVNGGHFIPHETSSLWTALKHWMEPQNQQTQRSACQQYAFQTYGREKFIRDRLAHYEGLVSGSPSKISSGKTLLL
jgi:glycosyltransferase involved in cell wall biosynthesis